MRLLRAPRTSQRIQGVWRLPLTFCVITGLISPEESARPESAIRRFRAGPAARTGTSRKEAGTMSQLDLAINRLDAAMARLDAAVVESAARGAKDKDLLQQRTRHPAPDLRSAADRGADCRGPARRSDRPPGRCGPGRSRRASLANPGDIDHADRHHSAERPQPTTSPAARAKKTGSRKWPRACASGWRASRAFDGRGAGEFPVRRHRPAAGR